MDAALSSPAGGMMRPQCLWLGEASKSVCAFRVHVCTSM